MNRVIRIFCLLLAFAAAPAMAQERIALVVGNSVYSTVPTLDNPANDARLIGETLEGLGFKVTLLIDSNQIEMKRGIAQFGRDLRTLGKETTGLFYYAGHGVQSFGTNYLLPVDIALSDPADLDLVAIEAQSVLRQMYSARNNTNIMILDACRNNPFSDIPDFNDNGLAEMQAPTGTFLSYATAPGGVALDGLDGNSPYTQAVAKQMKEPGLALEQMFKKVRVEVLKQTNNQQTPWDASSLTTNFVFAQATQQSVDEIAAGQLWNSIKGTRDPVQIMLFLRGYPDSSYTADAKKMLAEVMEAELAGNAPPKPAAPVQSPSDTEQKMFEAAQADAGAAGYEAYLQAYPSGVFAEFAQQELVAIRKKATTDPVGEGIPKTPEPEPAPTEQVATAPANGTITFNSTLSSQVAALSGRSIAEVVANASPMFPPVEGLPEEYWKTQNCKNCHKWTPDRLCTQANVYLSLNMQRSLDKQHPFGGALKRFLKSWAAGGCPEQ